MFRSAAVRHTIIWAGDHSEKCLVTAQACAEPAAPLSQTPACLPLRGPLIFHTTTQFFSLDYRLGSPYTFTFGFWEFRSPFSFSTRILFLRHTVFKATFSFTVTLKGEMFHLFCSKGKQREWKHNKNNPSFCGNAVLSMKLKRGFGNISP